MASDKFSIREAVRFGLDTTTNNLRFFIGLQIVALIILITPAIMQVMTEEDAPLLSIFFKIASSCVQVLVGMGFIKIALKFCDGEKGELGDLFSGFPLFIRYFVGSFLYGLIILGGCILLIVPGVIWAIQFQFFNFFIIDKKLKAVESLKRSSTITRGVKWDLFVFGLLLIGLNIVGALALLIGLLITIPTTMIAVASVYRKLLDQPEMTPVELNSA